MSRGADTADTLDIGPGIPRIAILQDDFQPTPGRPAGKSICYLSGTLVHLHLDAQMALDSRDRIYYYVSH